MSQGLPGYDQWKNMSRDEDAEERHERALGPKRYRRQEDGGPDPDDLRDEAQDRAYDHDFDFDNGW